MDLFTNRPPFNIHNNIVARELCLMEEGFVDRVASLEHCRRIINHETSYDMNRTQFDDLSLVDQLKALGIKSAPKQQILTPEQDKVKRVTKFGEDNIVGAWAKWFKLQHPGIPYVIDRKAQGKSKIRAMIEHAQDYKRGNPDIHIQTGRKSFIGAYIEQKKSEDIFYTGTRILKPGSNNQHIWQSLYHAELREHGYWVMFSISLDASIKITQRYMEGNPYTMQEYEYYCKPQDYPIFANNKHFKPVLKRP